MLHCLRSSRNSISRTQTHPGQRMCVYFGSSLSLFLPVLDDGFSDFKSVSGHISCSPLAHNEDPVVISTSIHWRMSPLSLYFQDKISICFACLLLVATNVYRKRRSKRLLGESERSCRSDGMIDCFVSSTATATNSVERRFPVGIEDVGADFIGLGHANSKKKPLLCTRVGLWRVWPPTERSFKEHSAKTNATACM